SDDAQRWSIYVVWLRSCWRGRVKEVIEALLDWQGKLGKPPEGEELDRKDPRRLVAEALSYLGNNQTRMDYPRYRKEGLPITSSLVESLVGEFNARVKGRDKYWNLSEGAEGIQATIGADVNFNAGTINLNHNNPAATGLLWVVGNVNIEGTTEWDCKV